MKRTTIYLDASLELRLKTEGLRRNQPMAELVREAVEAYLTVGPDDGPPGGGAFASGHGDTAERTDDILVETGFGGAPFGKSAGAKRRPSTKRGAGTKRRS